jgi:hypothetical protein
MDYPFHISALMVFLFNLHQKLDLSKKNITSHFVPSTDLLAMHFGADNERLTDKDEVKKKQEFFLRRGRRANFSWRCI